MNKRKYPNPDTLVALLKEKRDLSILREEGWYRIPVKSAPKLLQRVKYLAFYQPSVFEEEKCRVQYYGRIDIKRIKKAKRRELFPNELSHVRRDELYYRIEVVGLQKLPVPILNKRGRGIRSFFYTTSEKLCHAKEINDLFHESPLEDDLWTYLKNERIEAERQYEVRKKGAAYYLDFALLCESGNIAVECDGEWHHNPERAVVDNERSNFLERKGWHVLRYSTEQLQNPQKCLNEIKEAINRYGGLMMTDEQVRWFETVRSDGTMQLELFSMEGAPEPQPGRERPQEEFGYPLLTERAKNFALLMAKTLDLAGFRYGSAVGVMTHLDGSITVAVSGHPNAMRNAIGHLEPRLRELQDSGEISGYRFGPEMPDPNRTPLRPVEFPEGTVRASPVCAEPRLGEAARDHDSPPDGMGVVWRPLGARGRENPYPDLRDARLMGPCQSCADNRSAIMTGQAS